MRKFQLMFGLLTLSTITVLMARASYAETFDDRVCISMEHLGSAIAQHASEGTYTEVEYVGEDTLHVLVGHTMTVWAIKKGTALWCMQEHLGGQGV